MKMGSKDSYICYIPKPPVSTPPRQEDQSEPDVTPARSWSLLQPLSGTCIYHRQGWFTYSYCHNKEIRQFRELAQSVSRLPGPSIHLILRIILAFKVLQSAFSEARSSGPSLGPLSGTYQPEEDPEWESYTLGRAPRSPEDTGADLTVAERNAQAANLELARNAGSRYLVQRWGDGTICDKTGKPREVEVQFHCSMVMTDHILFVKEAKTCSYVLVIHTPRLCAEPGFKSRRDSGEETVIRCREVVDALPSDKGAMPKIISDQPFKFARPKTVLPPPQPKEKPSSSSPSSGGSPSKDDLVNQILRNALESILSGGSQGTEANHDSTDALKEAIEAGEVIVEFVDDPEVDPQSQRIVEALRAAGLDVRGEAVVAKKSGMKASPNDKDSKPKSEGDEKEGSRSQPKAKGRLQKILQEHLEL
ncbi:hypothetical protein NMY22_g17555 [Coprinellus aureogranulatus]|nr:hypothetical protein NMY22_g17555 [Coprinellus aureogranulatus]